MIELTCFNLFLKVLFLNLFAFYIFLHITNIKKNILFKIIVVFILVISSIILSIINCVASYFLVISIAYLSFTFIVSLLIPNKLNNLLLSCLLSFILSYVFLLLSAAIEFIFQYLFQIASWNINFMLSVLIEYILFNLLFQVKRLKQGFSFFRQPNKTETNYIDILVLCISLIVIIFGLNVYASDTNITISVILQLIICTIIIFIMIQKSLILYQHHKLLKHTIQKYEKAVKEKNKEIKKILNQKYELIKVQHEFHHRQSSLEHGIERLIKQFELNHEIGNELSVFQEEVALLNEDYKKTFKQPKRKLPKTNIVGIDNMFSYMQSECSKYDIDFILQINGNIDYMINCIIPKIKLETLIGDHLRNAIIAINYGVNPFKSILAILGMKNNIYEFRIYDSGIDFEIPTFIHLGLNPTTTHSNDGGSGVGFMTTFETLKETNASIIIEEKKFEENSYTKCITIRFDDQHKYIIQSYRAEQIQAADIEGRIEIYQTQ